MKGGREKEREGREIKKGKRVEKMERQNKETRDTMKIKKRWRIEKRDENGRNERIFITFIYLPNTSVMVIKPLQI